MLDRTATAPGGRILRDWLRRPLRDPEAIARRHRAVRALVEDGPLRERLRERLSRVGDLERLLSRAVLGSLTPREAATLRDSLRELPGLFAELEGAASEPRSCWPSSPAPTRWRIWLPSSGGCSRRSRRPSSPTAA